MLIVAILHYCTMIHRYSCTVLDFVTVFILNGSVRTLEILKITYNLLQNYFFTNDFQNKIV